MLKTELEERIAVLERVSSWREVVADLDSLTETEIEYDGKHFIVRSAPPRRHPGPAGSRCRAAADHPRRRGLLNPPIENVVPSRQRGVD